LINVDMIIFHVNGVHMIKTGFYFCICCIFVPQ